MSKTNNGFTKEFLSQIINLKNSYLLSIATIDMISHNDILSILEKDSFKTGNFNFEFKQISEMIRSSRQNNNKDFNILVWEFMMFTTRPLLTSLYEGFKNDIIRYEKVKNCDWFVFLANLRHSLSHGIDALWHINDFGKSEITYTRKIDKNKIVIEKSWDKSEMKFDQIGGWVTTLDLILYVENELRNNNFEKTLCPL